VLPAGLTYVKGSTVLYNKANTNGNKLADGIVSDKGVNIGDYAAGAEATVYFYATVNSSLKDKCEDTTLRNVVEGKYDNNDKTIEKDTADVKVNGIDCSEPEEPEEPELPKTGADSMLGSIIVISGTVTAAGYYIISRKK
jgi:LPXTG-motif cell wall-anchored protein